jgi:hypothetical protein
MPRHARTRTAVSSRHCAAEPPAGEPVLLGIIAEAAHFQELQARAELRHPDYRSYLEDLARLLHTLARHGTPAYGRQFHPRDLDRFCAERGLDPDAPGSHGAYTDDPTADTEWVRHRDQPLPEFLRALVRGRERGRVHRTLERMLVETAEAAPTGAFPDALLRRAYGEGVESLRSLLCGVEPGRYRLACAVDSDRGPVEVCVPLELRAGERMRLADPDLDLVCSLLCAGHALALRGRAVLYGPGTARGWRFEGCGFVRHAASDLLLDLSAPVAAMLAAPAGERWEEVLRHDLTEVTL